MSAVLTRTLVRERRPIIGWAVGVAFIVLITAGSWPGIEASSADFEEVLANLPDALTAFFGEGIASFSAAGIVGSRLYGTIGLALFLSYGVSRGARAIAGEEDTGTLELLVVQPLSRTRIAVDKIVALMLSLLGLIVLELVLLLAMMPAVGLEFSLGNVVAASTGLYLLSLLFGAMAFCVGAATGRRGAAVGVAGGVAGGLFVLTGLAQLLDGLAVLADVSPFSYYDGTLVLQEGVNVSAVAAFGVIAAALMAVGIWVFNRRDLS